MLNVEEFVLVWGVGTGTCTVESLRIPQLLAGAEEACWAHNPKVPGSKPGRANSFDLFVKSLLLPAQRVVVFIHENTYVATPNPRVVQWREVASITLDIWYSSMTFGSLGWSFHILSKLFYWQLYNQCMPFLKYAHTLYSGPIGSLLEKA